MKRDRRIYIATIVCTLLSTLIAITLLPDKISLSLDLNLKSKWYLVLLTATPLLSSFMLENSKGGDKLTWKIFFPVESYALLVVIDTLLYDLRMEHIILFLMILLFFFLSFETGNEKSKVKIQLKWIEKESDAYKKVQKKARIVFLLAGTLSLVFFMLNILKITPISYAFGSGVITVFLGSFWIIKTGI